jgi:hypothetical protein
MRLNNSRVSFFLQLAKNNRANRKRQKSCSLVVRMKVKIAFWTAIRILQVGYGLELHVETISAWIVCLHLEYILYLNKCPEMVLWKAVIYFIIKKTKLERSNLRNILEWFRLISWSLSHSSKPWSYGMCCYYLRGPKTQKCCSWLALHGWQFGGQAKLFSCFPKLSSQIVTSAACRNSSHVNCMSALRDNGHGPKWATCLIPPVVELLHFIHTGGIGWVPGL